MVQTWKNQYEAELKTKHKSGLPTELKKLACGRRGHPLLLGVSMDKEM